MSDAVQHGVQVSSRRPARQRNTCVSDLSENLVALALRQIHRYYRPLSEDHFMALQRDLHKAFRRRLDAEPRLQD